MKKLTLFVVSALILVGCGQQQYKRVPEKSSGPIANVVFAENGFVRDTSYDKDCDCSAFVNGDEVVAIDSGKLLALTSAKGMSKSLEAVVRELYGSAGATDIRYAITGLDEEINECSDAVCYMANPVDNKVVLLIWEK